MGLIASTLMSGTARAQFGLDKLLKKSKPETTSSAMADAGVAEIPAGRQSVVALGYSRNFIPIRALIKQGAFTDAMSNFALPVEDRDGDKDEGKADNKGKKAPAARPSEIDTKAITRDQFLANAELGLLTFERNGVDEAIVHLRAAEEKVKKKSVGGLFGKGVKWIGGKIIGRDDITDYDPFDHEAILQLNYLALSHLLKGDRSSYNVARRCMQHQADLKQKFDKQIAEYKAKLEKQTGSSSKLTDADRQSVDGLSSEFKRFDTIAQRVPNAYVNPLGDYVAGLIQEIASVEQPPLRDNSRIAYESAGRLCGGSVQLTAAAQAMARPRVPKGERVLHVIVGEGFSPARDVMTFGFGIAGRVLPLRIPIFTPLPSTIDRLEVYGGGNKKLATLDPIGDFEAIRLRHQSDRIPEILFNVMASGLGSYATAEVAGKAGAIGNALNDLKEANASPDTRSWLSLPRRFHIARVVLPVNMKAVQIASFAGSRKLATVPVDIPANQSQSVVYARAIEERLQVQNAQRLWVDGRLEVSEI